MDSLSLWWSYDHCPAIMSSGQVYVSLCPTDLQVYVLQDTVSHDWGILLEECSEAPFDDKFYPPFIGLSHLSWSVFHVLTHPSLEQDGSVITEDNGYSKMHQGFSCFVICFYPRPVLAFGYCHRLRLCVCVSVCVCVSLCVNHLFVRAITRDPFKLGSPNLDQRCKRPWLRSLLFLGVIDLDLQGQI